GHGRLQHHAIKKQNPRTWRGFVSNLTGAARRPFFSFTRDETRGKPAGAALPQRYFFRGNPMILKGNRRVPEPV
ncbi:hypothetical protein, partial [Burkholderia pseudomultivorans]|uniref:hypothetical protein n=1 Tax=Burkholderia pseudomultivorans TaxID=1207504 RepID=UPI001E50968A